MVSLVNFKIVDEELRPSGARHNTEHTDGAPTVHENGSVMSRTAFVRQRQPSDAPERWPDRTSPESIAIKMTNGAQRVGGRLRPLDPNTLKSSSSVAVVLSATPPPQANRAPVGESQQQASGECRADCHDGRSPEAQGGLIASQSSLQLGGRDIAAVAGGGTSFTVTWRNLKFCIEPKWHEKIASSSPFVALTNRVASTQTPAPLSLSRSPSSSATTAPHSMAAESVAQLQEHPDRPNEPVRALGGVPLTRVVLDRLDGSFRSGELTAILGPSGAGKTTLLDCLTGHRKRGLTGSIRISSTCNCACGLAGKRAPLELTAPSDHRSKNLILATAAAADRCKDCSHEHKAGAQSQPMNGDNLKVSIIPQNDHLIGHLTVYETLIYASKMKNCHERDFDHKLNVRRVAQQLALMSCLGNRINKLSGGQYKRVSIAQELLSSPDILILDEPTSGLDAMTCYQTVQVLKRLTDERQQVANRCADQKPIAVILTIHQPNSDVFQQFNHVYVVAQGGKCIYEGTPASIEAVINRVGIRLPNSYYNPATMIVEIAAGKFGQEAICKLNSIQKKQYEFCIVPDEQNSTGDSAVDCPSSSSSSSSSSAAEDDGELDELAAAEANKCTCCCPRRCSGTRVTRSRRPARGLRAAKYANRNENVNKEDEINNNYCEKGEQIGGLINKGFMLDDEPHAGRINKICCSEENDNNNNNNNKESDGVVVVMLDNNNDSATSQRAISLSPIGGCLKSSCEHGGELQQRERRIRKKRRTRRRTDRLVKGSEVSTSSSATKTNGNETSPLKWLLCSSFCGGGGDADGSGSEGGGGASPGGRGEKRLKLNSLKAGQKFPFWRHTYLHFHRSWLSIVRDPMLCSMQLALHIIVPVMVSLVYGTYVGKPNACPRAGPIDIMAYALEPTDTALQLQEDLRTTLENIGYIFFKLYGIIFAAMTVTVLTFPLDMHVLVKEFRNGWYGLSSYFLGRTLADIPFQLTLPLLAMSLSYYATGQPYSYMQWRFLSITAILIMSSLIAQSQGLLFGAILMDRMKAAVFVAPAATTPIILFAGFLVRTQSIPRYLRPLSNLSYLRYAIEGCLISRYGFNQCECDPAIFNQTVPELPPIARSMLDYWLSSFKPTTEAPTSAGLLDSVGNSSALTESGADQPDLFGKLIESLARANSFGRNITSCEQVVPYPMIDYDLKDSQLFSCFAILLAMLIFTRLLTFFIVCYKVKRKI